MGLPFAEKFIEFVKTKGLAAGQPVAIKQNPDQSKHLEPARVKILGNEIDFVNLRSEEYAVDSRIPVQVVSLYVSPLRSCIVTKDNAEIRYPSRGCDAARHHIQCSVLQYPHPRSRGPYRSCQLALCFFDTYMR